MRRVLTIKLCVLFVCMLLTTVTASAGPKLFRVFYSFDASNGLADNSAQTIKCTKTGRMVISTIGHINFYDGDNFTHIDPRPDDLFPLPKYNGHYHNYFDRFQTADGAIADIVKSLEKGAGVLSDDNVTLEFEQASLRDLTKQLNRKMQLGEDLDKYLTANIERLRSEGGDEEKLKFIEEEVLFPLRQRMIDFGQMQAVNQNGIVAMEVIRKNNLELIRSVNRAQTVTVSALTVAVTVAGALFNQKIVLEKVKALNAATNNMIAATSTMLKEQGVEVQKQAIESNIDVETMKTAFKDTLEALESISTYKQEALPKLRQTIDEFRTMTDEGEKILLRMEKTGDLKELPEAAPQPEEKA